MNKSGIVPPLRLVFFMWLVFSVEFFLQTDFGNYGILPRTKEGLIGILMAPLLHGNFQHLMSNTIPLLVLGGTLFFFFQNIASRVFLYCYLFTNILVWAFARPYYHIGASGLVYAIASFLIFYGFFQRNFKSVMISLITVFFYGGLAHGLFTLDARVSWESHLLGAVVGFGTAYSSSSKKNY